MSTEPAYPSRQRVRVLPVEDDPVEVQLLAASMRDRRVDHLHDDVAETLADAIAALDATPFDVVLLDLSLPDSQGLHTVTALLEAHPTVPVVVLTGNDDDRLAAAAIEAGAQDYLVKGSVAPEVLARVVQQARERHRLLTTLQQRERMFRAMAETAQDAIYRFRTRPTLAFEYLNPAVLDIVGITLEELQDDPTLCLGRVHPDDRWKLDLTELEAPDRTRAATVRFQHGDGEWRLLHDQRTPIVEDGVVVGVQGMVRDVTAEQRMAQALHDALQSEQAAAEQLRAVNELKGHFLQAVSHELRTPLTAIVGFSETLVKSADQLAPGQVSVFHERIRDNAQRLQLLLGDLLDLERLTHAGLQTDRVRTDVTELVRQVAAGLPMGGRRLVVEDTTCVAEVDPAMVERIARNLLANTVKHTPTTSSVTVRCTRDDVVSISVADDGPGVPDDLREQAFEPFWQGRAMQDAPSPGTGVGLSIVRQFAALHGGHAWLEATPGGGATVRVELADATIPRADVADATTLGDDVDGVGEPAPPQEALVPIDVVWRYLPLGHRRSLQRAMAELLEVTNELDATEVIVDHLVRTGATTVDAASGTHATVALDPALDPVHLTHPDETLRPTLPVQVQVLTDHARHAMATATSAPASGSPDEPSGAEVMLWATRSLLRCESMAELTGILLRAAHVLGGTVLPARVEDEDALPLDLTLGHGEPMLPAAPRGSVARALLERHLPGLVADARTAADRLRGEADRGGAGAGMATRAQLQEMVPGMGHGDALVALDLCCGPAGALEGDAVEAVVQDFAACVREQTRTGDHAARVGHDEFALLLRGAGRTGALEAVQRLRARWNQLGNHFVTFRAGVTVLAEDGPRVRTIEEALYLARSTGAVTDPGRPGLRVEGVRDRH